MHQSTVLQRPLAAHNRYCTHTNTMEHLLEPHFLNSKSKLCSSLVIYLTLCIPRQGAPGEASQQLTDGIQHKAPPTDNHYTKLLPVLQLN